VTDRRLTPSNGRVAHLSLQGVMLARRYTDGAPARIAVPLADLLAAPAGARDRQLLMGDNVTVLEILDGYAFVQSMKDGYCGYVAEAALGPARPQTHWVSAPATWLLSEPDVRAASVAHLSLGSHLSLTAGDHPRFAETIDGHYLPRAHVRALGDRPTDPVAVAELLQGTPYLWGGNSRAGIDCSGLVQAACLACGIPCPGDSDLQAASLGEPLGPGTDLRRGDLLFWKGHVALLRDAATMIHANGHHMMVTTEDIAAAVARTEASGGGPVTTRRRLPV
jgi:cell wall-associated NlpC family hydrolase